MRSLLWSADKRFAEDATKAQKKGMKKKERRKLNATRKQIHSYTASAHYIYVVSIQEGLRVCDVCKFLSSARMYKIIGMCPIHIREKTPYNILYTHVKSQNTLSPLGRFYLHPFIPSYNYINYGVTLCRFVLFDREISMYVPFLFHHSIFLYFNISLATIYSSSNV